MLYKQDTSIKCNNITFSDKIILIVNGKEVKPKSSYVICLQPLNLVMAQVTYEY